MQSMPCVAGMARKQGASKHQERSVSTERGLLIRHIVHYCRICPSPLSWLLGLAYNYNSCKTATSLNPIETKASNGSSLVEVREWRVR